jgi:hypothetical protein
MKKILFGLFVLFVLEGCVPQALNYTPIGMTIQEFMKVSKNQATLESSSNGVTIYKYRWADPGSSYPWNTTFYYFSNDKLFEFNGGVRTGPPPQLRLNYNMN